MAVPSVARLKPGPLGVFLGFDFHLTGQGPQLIEINTNAGGALFNAVLARAQRACCREMFAEFEATADLNNLERVSFEMFREEWRRQRGEAPIGRVAIVDVDPAGKAAYRGCRLTPRVWQEILQSEFVAQAVVTPSERRVEVDGADTDLKPDVRAYVYAGGIQLVAARLYGGQTTNFRTPRGGFAPVFVVRAEDTSSDNSGQTGL